MFRILIDPSTYEIDTTQDDQNPFVNVHFQTDAKKVKKHHEQLARTFTNSVAYYANLGKDASIPDIVFCASAGLSLPRLSGPLVLLPNMKYPQRKAELPYVKEIFKKLGIPTIDYPGSEVFEGQAEIKWFDGGRKAVCSYGYRSTKKTVEELKQVFQKVYGLHMPEILALPVQSSNYYHLDLAMLEYSDRQCIVHKEAFSAASLHKLQKFLGKKNVTVIETDDVFALNAIVDGKNLITHKLTDPKLKPLYEKITGLVVKQIDTTEFEKSGGSVRCMTLDIYQ